MNTSLDKSRLTTAGIALASFAILGTVFVAQYGFGLLPCELCFAQRPPYALAFTFAALASLSAVGREQRRAVVLLCAGIFALGVILAGYHAGVEWQWWRGPTACTGGGKIDFSNLAAALEQPGFVACDQPAFRFFGLSMAGYNFLASAALTIGCLYAATRGTWWTQS